MSFETFSYLSFAFIFVLFIYVLRLKDENQLKIAKKVTLWSTLIVTFLLINLGGFVHNTGSSLACPDWPLCYGEVIPKMEGGILYEHSHRLLGALVGYLAILLSVLSFKIFGKSSRNLKFALFSLILVIFQGVLGGLTVIYKLPTIVSTMHLGTSMLFLASVIYQLFIFEKSFEQKPEVNQDIQWNKSLLKHASYLVLFVYAQMILGAAMRHLGLGGVCGTGPENMFACFDMVTFKKSFFPESSQAKLHIMHRYFAYAIAAYVLYYSYQLLNVFKNLKTQLSKRIKFKLMLLPFIVTSQVLLGLATVGTNLGLWPTTLHLGGAALLFGTLVKLFFEVKEFKRINNFQSEKYDYLSDLFSMSKPRLSMLVIFTAGIGMYLAPGKLGVFSSILNLFLITSIVAGACTLNCLIEKDVDKKMKRTATRPLASGRVSPTLAGLIGVILCAVGVAGLVIYSNTLTAVLGMFAAVSYVLMYTPMKQYTPHAVFMGAIPGAMPPLMGYTASSNELGIIGLILFAVLFVWQLPHFMAISLMYSKDYEQAGIIVFPNFDGAQRTVKRIFMYSIVLVAIAILPSVLFLTTSKLYLLASLMLGSASMYYAYKGLNIKKEAVLARWSKKFFFSTIIYLPLQLGLMISQI